jgi:hypothetical protein
VDVPSEVIDRQCKRKHETAEEEYLVRQRSEPLAARGGMQLMIPQAWIRTYFSEIERRLRSVGWLSVDSISFSLRPLPCVG